MNLSEFHLEQVTKYLRFFRGKRKIQLQEIENLFEDAKDSRLSDREQVFSYDEVDELLGGLLDSVRANVHNELVLVVNMSVLAIQQLFEDADSQDLELTMDTSKIEDAALVEEVENLQIDSTALAHPRKRKGKLTSLRDEHQRIMDENERLKSDLEKANNRANGLQDKCNELNNKISNCVLQIESLKSQVHGANESRTRALESKSEAEAKLNKYYNFAPTSSMQSLQDLLDTEQHRASNLQAELEDAKSLLASDKGIDFDNFTSMIKNSKQFSQLKKTLQQKIEQLTDLRRRFQVYEPDQTTIDDCMSSASFKK